MRGRCAGPGRTRHRPGMLSGRPARQLRKTKAQSRGQGGRAIIACALARVASEGPLQRQDANRLELRARACSSSGHSNAAAASCREND